MDNAIVIGGGPAGLIAACKLADAGIPTTVLETKADLGGRAASEHAHEFDLNQGPHALYIGGPAMRELKALGIKPAWWNPVSVTGSFLIQHDKAMRKPDGVGGAVKLARAAMKHPAGLERISTAEWIADTVDGEDARMAAAAAVRVATFVADQQALSADVAAEQLRLAVWPSVRYLKGGWSALVGQLAEAARQRGVKTRTRAAVREIERRGGGWVVVTAGGEHEARTVIVAAGQPSAVAKLVGDRITPPGPAVEVSSLDIGLRRLPAKRTFGLGIDTPVYISRHSPPRHKAGTLMSVAGYTAQSREELEHVADILLPGWREQAIFTRHLPKMTPVSAIATPATGGLPGRPSVAVPDAPGLFLAGDWIGPEGWLVDAAIASAAAAATEGVRSAHPTKGSGQSPPRVAAA